MSFLVALHRFIDYREQLHEVTKMMPDLPKDDRQDAMNVIYAAVPSFAYAHYTNVFREKDYISRCMSDAMGQSDSPYHKAACTLYGRLYGTEWILKYMARNPIVTYDLLVDLNHRILESTDTNFTAAYIVNGWSKNAMAIATTLMRRGFADQIATPSVTLKQISASAQRFIGIGPFIGHQIAQDQVMPNGIRHTDLPSDYETYTELGPGSKKALQLIKEQDGLKTNCTALAARDFKTWSHREKCFVPLHLRAADIEHALCETYKMWRIEVEGGFARQYKAR